MGVIYNSPRLSLMRIKDSRVVLCFIFSVLRELFFLCSFVCSLLFECQKVAKTCVTREKQSAVSLLRICRQYSSVEPSLSLKLFP